MRTAASIAACLIGCASAAAPSAAQSVGPVVVEYTGQASGRFELSNQSIYPLTVVLEARSFDIDENGEFHYRPLDPEIDLQLSAMSMRLPPRQSRMVFYDAASPNRPAWFTIYAQFKGLPGQAGIDIELELPHTVLLYDSEDAAPDVRVAWAAEDPSGGLAIRLVNEGSRLGRITRISVSGDDAAGEIDGFPLLPGSDRIVRLPWNGAGPASLIRIEGLGFEVEHSLARPVRPTGR